MNPVLRASDTDRERTVAQLQEHVGAGRLTLDEFSQRAATAYHAQTLGELADLTHDLSTSSPPPATPGAPSRGLPRMLLPLLGVAVLLVLVGSVLLMPSIMGSMAAACH